MLCCLIAVYQQQNELVSSLIQCGVSRLMLVISIEKHSFSQLKGGAHSEKVIPHGAS